jgi:hypothetical protein
MSNDNNVDVGRVKEIQSPLRLGSVKFRQRMINREASCLGRYEEEEEVESKSSQ